MSAEHLDYVPPQKPEDSWDPRHPFKNDLERLKLKKEGDFELHQLGKPDSEIEFADGAEREFKGPDYAVTEYHDTTGKKHKEFVRLKKFYEAAAEELGPYLPKTMFVEGHPSRGGSGKSFYVIQKFEQGFEDAKDMNDLNRDEFTTEFAEQLLDIQSRIESFLERHAQDLPEDWIDEGSIDPRKFNEDVIYSPTSKKASVVNMFRFDPEQAKKVVGSEAGFESRSKILKALGMIKLVEDINWALEKSAAAEWLSKKYVPKKLNKEKMKALEAEGKKVMALTFDDGPNEETEKLLDILKEKGVKATFFLVGSLIKGREHIVKRIVDEGHDVGTHEWSHPGDSAKTRFLGPWKYFGDAKKGSDAIEAACGVRPKLARQAGIHATVDSMREHQSLDLQLVLANPYDLARMMPSPKLKAPTLLKRAMSRPFGNGHGRIRIFHIGNMTNEGVPLRRDQLKKDEVFPADQTLAMIEEYIDKSRKEGYDFVKVQEYL